MGAPSNASESPEYLIADLPSPVGMTKALAQDQVADYAKRKGWTLPEAERWLAPNLGYNPED